MRVAIVTESFLPNVNGVTNSVLRLLENLAESGDQALVIAPDAEGVPSTYAGHPVRTTAVIPTQNFLPVNMPMGIPHKRIEHLIDGFSPDVIHLASPFALGAYVTRIARRLNIPTLSVYQTDLGGFAKQYGLGLAQNSLQKLLHKIHSSSNRTLAPSTSSCLELHLAGVPEVYLWRRGVDSNLFDPNKIDAQLRKLWQLGNKNKLIIGYVGRLAQEKRLLDLMPLDDNPNFQLVIVGDGPHRKKLERNLPNAIFLGFKSGEELAKIYASFDLFIHPGPNETFCQSVQEALSSGVPAIVPKTGGPVDLVDHGRTGYSIDISDSEKLLTTVKAFYFRKNRSQMKAAARDSVKNRTWDTIFKELKLHYQDLIQLHSGNKVVESSGVA
jgi:phosphatidylinositol alpha 1,6-mannosyltransferase